MVDGGWRMEFEKRIVEVPEKIIPTRFSSLPASKGAGVSIRCDDKKDPEIPLQPILI